MSGLYYKFKVEARNYLFYSDPSEFVQILCATRPSQPTQVETTNDADYIRVDWQAPDSNGLPITAYKVLFRQFDNQYVQDLGSCMESDSSLVSDQ